MVSRWVPVLGLAGLTLVGPLLREVDADLINPTALSCCATAKWLGPWAFTLLAREIVLTGFGSEASAERDFGNPGGVGEPEDLPGQRANAAAIARAIPASFGDAFAKTGVEFSRVFELSGSPDGWSLTIHGVLRGLLGSSFDEDPLSIVTASAKIAGGPSVDWGTISLVGLEDKGRTRAINIPMSETKKPVTDGIYTVKGELITTALIDRSGFFGQSGEALADFFAPRNNVASGLFVSVEATAIPQPHPILLVGMGVVAGMYFMRHRYPRGH